MAGATSYTWSPLAYPLPYLGPHVVPHLGFPASAAEGASGAQLTWGLWPGTGRPVMGNQVALPCTQLSLWQCPTLLWTIFCFGQQSFSPWTVPWLHALLCLAPCTCESEEGPAGARELSEPILQWDRTFRGQDGLGQAAHSIRDTPSSLVLWASRP